MLRTLAAAVLVLLAAVPAALGLLDNASFSEDLPVRAPDPVQLQEREEEPREERTERREERREERAERREERREERAERRQPDDNGRDD